MRTTFEPTTTFEDIRREAEEFANARDWNQFHYPRNLLLALVGEIGELSEIFQWRGDKGSEEFLPGWSDEEKVHLGEELSDVLIYTIRLADRCGIDLPTAVKRKIQKNARKYPVEKAYGSSAKYTAYEE